MFCDAFKQHWTLVLALFILKEIEFNQISNSQLITSNRVAIVFLYVHEDGFELEDEAIGRAVGIRARAQI
jgi:hypothetical protein